LLLQLTCKRSAKEHIGIWLPLLSRWIRSEYPEPRGLWNPEWCLPRAHLVFLAAWT